MQGYRFTPKAAFHPLDVRTYVINIRITSKEKVRPMILHAVPCEVYQCAFSAFCLIEKNIEGFFQIVEASVNDETHFKWRIERF